MPPPRNAAAVAEQQGVDEKFKQLSANIASLRSADQALLDQLSALKADLQQLRTEQSRLSANSSVQDDLKLLARKIEDVDKKTPGRQRLDFRGNQKILRPPRKTARRRRQSDPQILHQDHARPRCASHGQRRQLHHQGRRQAD